MSAICAEPSRTPPRILLVDDDPRQLKLTRLQLEQQGYSVETATNAADALARCAAVPPDLVVSDVLMGELDGLGLCRRLRADPRFDAVPILLLTAHREGASDDELAAKVGAARLLQRTPEFERELAAVADALSRRTSVTPAVADTTLYEQLLERNAKQITRLIGEAESAEERYRTLFTHASDAIALLTHEGVVLEANERWHSLIGVDPAAMPGRRLQDFVHPDHPADANLDVPLAAGLGRSGPVPLQSARGDIIYVEFSFTTLPTAGRPTILSIGRDVSAEVQAQRALAAAEERYRTLIERLPDVIWRGRLDGVVVFATPNLQKVTGYTLAELGGATMEDHLLRVHPDDRSAARRAAEACWREGKPIDLEYRLRHKDGRWVWVRQRATVRFEPDGTGYFEGQLSDIDERKVLEESLLQAQKMEAIGQLTGGIAHDFNNILAAILANSHFLLDSLAPSDPRRADADEIRVASERAASLTRQLLAFSRRQVLNPAVVDLNDTVSGVEKMLCRLIGEDITLAVVPAPELGAVRIDVGQIEQVIMNLAVNARDAMPLGGRLTIMTANVELTADAADGHAALEPGRYVRLSVSDTGCGMDEVTRRRIFEPFFTTKEPGKGTGLGLSTVYGIVKQSGGCIRVESTPGKGTVFQIYLPRVDAVADVATTRPSRPLSARSETLLLVEDDPHLRGAIARMLNSFGYRTLAASDAFEAKRLAEAHGGRIHLVLTDVVMPGSSGPALAECMRQRFGAEVLFMSGYTEHAALRSGVLEGSHAFIQKPFTPEALGHKLREILDAAAREPRLEAGAAG